MSKIVLGVYGGICSGKSLACRVLAEYNVRVLDMDKLAHEAYVPGTQCWEEVLAAFPGTEGENGVIDRKRLGAIVFGDASGERLAQLGAIVHPHTKVLLHNRLDEARSEGCPAVAVEAALLMESPWWEECTHMWLFYVTPEEAIRRMIESRDLTPPCARQRLSKQISNDRRIDLVEDHFPEPVRWILDRTELSVEAATALIRNQIETQLLVKAA